MTTPAVTPWSSPEPPSRETLEAIFRRNGGLLPGWWSNRRGYSYSVHSHRYRKVLHCAQGSIRFRAQPSGQTFDLSPGDRHGRRVRCPVSRERAARRLTPSSAS